MAKRENDKNGRLHRAAYANATVACSCICIWTYFFLSLPCSFLSLFSARSYSPFAYRTGLGQFDRTLGIMTDFSPLHGDSTSPWPSTYRSCTQHLHPCLPRCSSCPGSLPPSSLLPSSALQKQCHCHSMDSRHSHLPLPL